MERGLSSKIEQPVSTTNIDDLRKKLPEVATHLPNLARRAIELRKIDNLRRLINEMGKTPEVHHIAAGAIGKAAGEVASRSERVSKIVAASHQSRQEVEGDQGNQRGLTYHAVKTVLEMLPGGLGPYGIGDAITLVEAIRGKEIWGRKLDIVDRIISLAAALIPVVPATPFREMVRSFRRHFEDTVVKNRKS